MTAKSNVSLLSEDDIFWFNEGTHLRLYDKLGAHLGKQNGKSGVNFAVWAPNASAVSVVGDFNGWTRGANSLQPRASSGIWEGFIEGMQPGEVYKYHIVSQQEGYRVDKATHSASTRRYRPRRRRGSGTWTTSGATQAGWTAARNGSRWRRRFRSTSCIWARGATSRTLRPKRANVR
jgi:1,4-alpha-glucan branching enzyme